MDQIYLWIIILFAVILILDYSERLMRNKKENFDNLQDKMDSVQDTDVNLGIFDNNFDSRSYDDDSVKKFPPYYEENRLNVYQPTVSSNAINISSTSTNGKLNFSNFGTNGVEPPYVKCPSCSLQFDCSNYPYEMSDKNGNVCTTCFEKSFLDSNNMPVFSRAVGKPRVCRNLK
jgi:hypothetical protein